MNNGTQNNRKNVYTIIEKEGRKPFWMRIGSAFVNRDGSLNVRLAALPVDGKLHIRDPKNGNGNRQGGQGNQGQNNQQSSYPDDDMPF